MPKVPGGSQGGERSLVSEVPLQACDHLAVRDPSTAARTGVLRP